MPRNPAKRKKFNAFASMNHFLPPSHTMMADVAVVLEEEGEEEWNWLQKYGYKHKRRCRFDIGDVTLSSQDFQVPALQCAH